MSDKNSRQLKAFHSALVSASPDNLDPNVMQGWIDNPASLARTIRKALTPPDETVKAVPPYAVAVDYGLSLEEMVAAGRYDWTNSDITAKNFPVKGRGKVQVEIELIHFNRVIDSNDALRELDRMGLRPATLHELLAFGAKYQEVQRQFPVVALGSVWQHWGGCRCVPCLWSNARERYLYLDWFGHGWRGHDRFAAVRK